jgi:hypothetical protein
MQLQPAVMQGWRLEIVLHTYHRYPRYLPPGVALLLPSSSSQLAGPTAAQMTQVLCMQLHVQP